MNLFNKKDLLKLEEVKTKTNLTILVPTYRANEDEQNRIGFKNAVKEAEQALEKHGKDEEEIKRFLKPLKELGEQEHFWDHQSDTLAIFMNENHFEYYTLPVSTAKMTYLGEDFFVKPLLNLIEGHGVAHIMTVSSNKVRLLSFTEFQVIEHDISEEFPQNLEESKWHMDKSRSLQSHGGGKAFYHGHGAGKDAQEEDIKRFFRDVKTGLSNFFTGETHKIILAGVDNTVRLFKETFDYNNFTDRFIYGNHDETSPLELHSEAKAILKKQEEEKNEKEMEEMKNLLHTAQAEQSIDQIMKASITGRVDKLFILKGALEWGYVDEKSLKIEHSEAKTNGQVDLLNQSAIQTILNGGSVRVLPEEMMGENVALAHLRH